MSKEKEISMEEKLLKLYDLQTIDTQIDKLQTLRGELPLEVKDLEDEIEGLNTRLTNLENEVVTMKEDIAHHKNNIVEATTLIAKYTKQQNNVKNNREFDALTKEIELQNLEIQLSEKKTKDGNYKIEAKKQMTEDAKAKLAVKEGELKIKKKELDKIISETDKEEKELNKQSKVAEKGVDDRLLSAYNRIRGAYRNGLAVVTVERDACGGCFAEIPPQLQVEISQRKKVILCEHCGRILVAHHLVMNEA
jgi:predicted  nucleic acid-binding Zn-ribbon protein